MVSIDYNRCGAAYTDVIALYPGTQDSDYGTASGVADSTAGQTAINAALDEYTREAMAAVGSTVYDQLTNPQAELLIDRATAAQSSATLGLFPVVTGSVHLFRFSEWPSRMPQVKAGWDVSPDEIETGDYSVTDATGAIDLSSLSPALEAGEIVFATYETDTSSWTIPSLKDKIILGAAAELGGRLFARETTEWDLVTQYRERWIAWKEDAAAGKWVPDELRKMRWFREVDKPRSMGSIRIGRGGGSFNDPHPYLF